MAFKFDWSKWDRNDFEIRVRASINEAIVKALTNRDTLISVVPILHSIHFGDREPMLELLDIGELSNDSLRLTFAMQYRGNAEVRFNVSAQLNPLVSERKVGARGRQHMGILAAARPMALKIFLAISHWELDGTLEMIVIKDKQATVSIPGDLMCNVTISSSFDGSPIGPTVRHYAHVDQQSLTHDYVNS